MSTQLRLVDTPRRTGEAHAKAARTGRRAVRWPDWRLDPKARTVGQRGVARARAALERAGRPGDPTKGRESQLPKAS